MKDKTDILAKIEDNTHADLFKLPTRHNRIDVVAL